VVPATAPTRRKLEVAVEVYSAVLPSVLEMGCGYRGAVGLAQLVPLEGCGGTGGWLKWSSYMGELVFETFQCNYRGGGEWTKKHHNLRDKAENQKADRRSRNPIGLQGKGYRCSDGVKKGGRNFLKEHSRGTANSEVGGKPRLERNLKSKGVKKPDERGGVKQLGGENSGMKAIFERKNRKGTY